MHSYTEENYLKALFNLANEMGEVSANALASSSAGGRGATGSLGCGKAN